MRESMKRFVILLMCLTVSPTFANTFNSFEDLSNLKDQIISFNQDIDFDGSKNSKLTPDEEINDDVSCLIDAPPSDESQYVNYATHLIKKINKDERLKVLSSETESESHLPPVLLQFSKFHNMVSFHMNVTNVVPVDGKFYVVRFSCYSANRTMLPSKKIIKKELLDVLNNVIEINK
jgi:hypothetical protein